MVKRKIITKKMMTLALVLLILSVIGVIYYSSPKLITQTELPTDNGDVKFEFYECGKFCELLHNPVEQTVYFSTSEFTSSTLSKTSYFKVGDSISLYSRITCDDYSSGSTGTTKLDAKVYTVISNEDTHTSITKTNTLSGITNHVYVYATATYPSSTTGTYSTYNYVDCYRAGTTTKVDSKSYSGLTRNFVIQPAAVVCPSPKKNVDITMSATGYSNVAEFQCEQWYIYNSPTCSITTETRNCDTACKSDSYCDNSYSSQTCSGKVSCVKKPVECTADKTTKCTDGSSIVTKSCVDGKYVNTDALCPTDYEETPAPTSTITETPIDQEYTTDTTTPVTSTPDTSDETEDTENENADNEYPISTILSWIIVGLIVVIIGVIGYKIYRDKKGRKK